MLVLHNEDIRTVELHRTKDGKGLCSTFNFDPKIGLPWQCRIDLWHCECASDATDDERAVAIEHIAAELNVSRVAMVASRVRAGATTLTEREVLQRARGKFSSTTLAELRKVGRFPEPVLVNKRNLWLESEAMYAIAMFVSDEGHAALRRARPMNRHERRAKAKAR